MFENMGVGESLDLKGRKQYDEPRNYIVRNIKVAFFAKYYHGHQSRRVTLLGM
jgi:hypothetical protein